jgi:2-polyprenyl-3-methyl-5-hydroxy-6-metoxy-1,4-benzoquinol methylase
MTDNNSEEVRAFFNKLKGPRTYLEKRFGVDIRVFITRKLLGEVAGSIILDIGCGDGALSLQYAGRENRLTLIDLSDKMLEAARKNAPVGRGQNITYLNMNFLEYVPDQPFDIILCVGVLAHVQSLDILAKKLSSHLKPGGRCLIQFIDNNSWIAKMDWLYFSLYNAVNGNPYAYSVQKFTHHQVIHCFLQNDFEVMGQCRYSLLFPGWAVFQTDFSLNTSC